MRFDSYDQVREADPGTYRLLLRDGDGPERVWAAWALAIELAGPAAPILASGLRPEPDPGVRIHWVTILAGLGERQVLETLFREDPDDSVRAAAGQYLLRTCAPDRGPAQARALIEQLGEDPSPQVLSALFRTVPADWESLPIELVSGFASHPSSAVRHATIEYLTRAYPADQLFPAILEPLLLEQETEPESIGLIAECAVRAGADEALLVAAARSPEARHNLLELLAGRRFPFESFGELRGDRDPRVMKLLFGLVSKWDGEPALCWLASAAFPEVWYERSASYPDPIAAAKADAKQSLASAARPTLIKALERHDGLAGTDLKRALSPLAWSLVAEIDELHTTDSDQLREWGIDRDAALARAAHEERILTRVLGSSLTSQ